MAEDSEEIQEKVSQLSMLEQSMRNLSEQRQQFQIQLNETESALKEINGKDTAYKILGNVMILKKTKEIEKDLGERKEFLEVRINSLENQEKKIKEKAESMQKEVLAKIKKK